MSGMRDTHESREAAMEAAMLVPRRPHEEDDGLDEMLDWSKHDQCVTPDKSRRGCSDALTLLMLIGFLAFLPYCIVEGELYGNMEEFAVLHDFTGQHCNHNENVGKRYLFFCDKANKPGHLALAYPFCVESCPRSSDTHTLCHVSRGNVTRRAIVQDYPSSEFVSMMCMPEDPDRRRQVYRWISNRQKSSMVFIVSSVVKVRFVIFITIVLAVLLSYGYLISLRYTADAAITISMNILWITSGAFGVYLVNCSYHGGHDGMDGTGERLSDFTLSMILLGASCLVFCVSCYQQRALDQATSVIEAASKCIMVTRSMVVEPLLNLGSRFICVGICLREALLIVSSMEEQETGDDDSCTAQFNISWRRGFKLLYLAFMAWWLHDTLWATQSFSIAYVAQLWHFDPKSRQGRSADAAIPCLRRPSMLRAHFKVLRYHLGSMAAGALVNGFFFPLRTVVSLVGAVSQVDGNPVSTIIGVCCCWAICCYERLQPFSASAYLDMALNGGSFCSSAYYAHDVMMDHVTTKHILSGATKAFQISGLGCITMVTYVTTWIILKIVPDYSDHHSPNFVTHPGAVATVNAWIGFVVALPFMVILDGVAESLLFCYAVEKRRDVSKQTHSGVYGLIEELVLAVENVFGAVSSLATSGSTAEKRAAVIKAASTTDACWPFDIRPVDSSPKSGAVHQSEACLTQATAKSATVLDYLWGTCDATSADLSPTNDAAHAEFIRPRAYFAHGGA